MYRVSSSWKLFMTLPSLCSSSSYILSRICSIPGTHMLPGHLAFGNSSSIGNPEKVTISSSATLEAKVQKPSNVSLGIPSSLAMSPVHHCTMSDMMQLGGGHS
uniref:Uncharacterized protein n=1 Tax=Oryza meridionalis TaxID=40149 RepID=A0A0E0BXY6_9ORYZ